MLEKNDDEDDDVDDDGDGERMDVGGAMSKRAG